MAADVMEEIGIDISAQRSKSVDEMLSREFDYVITVCDKAREFCPIFPGSTTSLHWNIEDPAEFQGSLQERRAAFRQVREKLKDTIVRFIKSHK
jgi:arsenate reductase (thioredoxin)